MNQQATEFFEAYKKSNSIEEDVKVSAWQFGVDADELADLVVQGKKRGTCSLYKLYEIDNDPLPEVGQYDIVLNSKDEPVVLIQNRKVEIVPMKDVTKEFALSEGEGDGTCEYWWNAHVEFFSELVKEYDLTFTTDDLLVCETFEVVKVR